MKNKKILYTFKCNPYPMFVEVVDWEFAKADCGEFSEYWNAVVYTNKGPKNSMRVSFKDKEKTSLTLINHETVHIVNGMFLRLGILPDRENDETQAYLHSYIFTKLYDFLINKDKK